MSIRTRLFLLVFAVWLPAAIGFALLAYSTFLRETESARTRVEQLTESLNIVVERELDQRAVMAKMLATSRAVRDGDVRRFHEEATSATEGSGSWVMLVDRSTQLANTLVPFDQLKTRPRSQGAGFQTGDAGVYLVREPLLRRPVLGVFAPESNVAPPRYNIGVSVEPAVIQSVVDAQELPEASVAAVIDGNQRVMARSRDPDKWFGTVATGDVKRRAESGMAGFLTSTTLDGVDSLSYLSKPSRYGWRAIVALPAAAFSMSARRVTLQAVAASGLLLLAGLGFALLAARRISAPVVALREAALQLGQDEIPARLRTGVSEADEVSAALHEAGVRSKEATKTLKRRVDEAVEQAQEAQVKLLEARKHEAIGRLTGGLAHDFNNLLQTISTAHHLLDRSIDDGPQRRVLSSAVRATGKAADLVRQMLTFGRAQALEPQPLRLEDLVLKGCELAGKAVGERAVLSADIEPGLPQVFVDPVQLDLALLNLIFNARDAMPDGGSIVISGRLARDEETASLAPGRYVCLQISDDGPGMEAEVLAKAFDPYFTTKPVGAGSGLGLAQVLAFARQSGGDVRMESTVGQGTRVAIYLPTTDSAPAEPEAEGAAQRATRALNVLMVEDDVLVSSIVLSALESAGHQVHLCNSAEEAMQALSPGHEFDVLFTDVVMPGKMSGLDLVAWCSEHFPRLPVVVASGYTTQSIDAPAQVLRKPYEMSALLGALQAAVEG